MTAPHREPNYIMIFVWLTILTVVEIATTKLPLSRLSIAVLLVGEAITKALLVALYFMHLRFEKKTLAMIAASPLVLCVFLSLMLMPDSTGAKDSVVPVPSAAPSTPGAGGEGHEAPASGEAPAEEAGHESPAVEAGHDGTSGQETPSGEAGAPR